MFFFKKITLVGLGFKCFLYEKDLWLYTGLSHFVKFSIPDNVTIYCRKKKIYIFSFNKRVITNFLRQIKFYRLPNKYKGKGILEFKQFKGFITLKKGKRQQ